MISPAWDELTEDFVGAGPCVSAQLVQQRIATGERISFKSDGFKKIPE